MYVPHGCLNLQWNEDGSIRCVHGDLTPCPEADRPHTTISTYVRSADLKAPTLACPTCGSTDGNCYSDD